MNEDKHPWEEFLDARVKCILWMNELGRSDAVIAHLLSMDEQQVYQIRKNSHIHIPQGTYIETDN